MFVLFLIIFLFILSSVPYSNCEDLIFRNLKYRFYLKRDSTTKRSATEPHEFIHKGKNDYLCTVNAIKEYNEYLSASGHIPKVNGISYDNLDSYFKGLMSKCLIHYDSENLDSFYSICFFSQVVLMEYTELEALSNVRVYKYVEGNKYTDEVLNYNSASRTLNKLNNFHTQLYKGPVCPHDSDASYELRLNFYCDHNIKGLFICKTQHVTECFTEMVIYDNKLCSIPLFQPDFNFSGSSSRIECQLISEVPIKIPESPAQIWYKNFLENSKTVLKDVNNFVSIHLNREELSQKMKAIYDNTRYIVRPDENGVLNLHSEITKPVTEDELFKKFELGRLMEFLKDNYYFNQAYNNEIIINLEAYDRNVRFLSDVFVSNPSEGRRIEKIRKDTDRVEFDDDF